MVNLVKRICFCCLILLFGLSGAYANEITLPQRRHPFLFADANQIQRVLRKADEQAWARTVRDEIIASADEWLDRLVKLPDKGGQSPFHYKCKECAVWLEAIGPTKHRCPVCGKIYSGWPYDDVYIRRQHQKYLKAIRNLAVAYIFTDREEYAAKAVEILLGYAKVYKTYPLHNYYGNISDVDEKYKADNYVAGRLFASTLDDASHIIDVIWGYDLIYNCKSLNSGKRRLIENNFFREVATVVRGCDRDISNWQSWHNVAIAAIGFCLEDDDLVNWAVNGKSGLKFQLKSSVLSDGFWHEGTPAYHYYALNAFTKFAMMAKAADINLYDHPKFKALFDAPLEYMMPDGKFPAINDSDVFSINEVAFLYDIAYAIWRDQRYAFIAKSEERGFDALFWGDEQLGDSEQIQLKSRNFSGLGSAVLRNQGKHGQNYLLLDYGPHGGDHGHFDKLNIVFFAHGQILSPDPGRCYGLEIQNSWYTQSAAHNTVVVDGESQKPAAGKLIFLEACGAIQAASATCDDAYAGVRMVRTLILLEEGFLDVFRVFCDKKKVIDWVYHNHGDIVMPDDVTALKGKLSDSGAYQHVELFGRLKTADDWKVLWKINENLSVQLNQNGAEGTEIYFAKGVGQPPAERVPMVVVRRKARETTFVSFVEASQSKSYVPTVKLIPITEDGKLADPCKTLAIEIQKLTGKEVIIMGTSKGTLKEAGGFSTVDRLARFIRQ